MKKKNGFTLIEIIISIALIALIGTITTVSINKIKEDDELKKEKYLSIIKLSTQVYYENNKKTLPKFTSMKKEKVDYRYITLGDLIEYGLLAEEEYNPFSKTSSIEAIDVDEYKYKYVKIFLDEDLNIDIKYPTDPIDENALFVFFRDKNDYILPSSRDMFNQINDYIKKDSSILSIEDFYKKKFYTFLKDKFKENFEENFEESGCYLGDSAGNEKVETNKDDWNIEFSDIVNDEWSYTCTIKDGKIPNYKIDENNRSKNRIVKLVDNDGPVLLPTEESSAYVIKFDYYYKSDQNIIMYTSADFPMDYKFYSNYYLFDNYYGKKDFYNYKGKIESLGSNKYKYSSEANESNSGIKFTITTNNQELDSDCFKKISSTGENECNKNVKQNENGYYNNVSLRLEDNHHNNREYKDGEYQIDIDIINKEPEIYYTGLTESCETKAKSFSDYIEVWDDNVKNIDYSFYSGNDYSFPVDIATYPTLTSGKYELQITTCDVYNVCKTIETNLDISYCEESPNDITQPTYCTEDESGNKYSAYCQYVCKKYCNINGYIPEKCILEKMKDNSQYWYDLNYHDSTHELSSELAKCLPYTVTYNYDTGVWVNEKGDIILNKQ